VTGRATRFVLALALCVAGTLAFVRSAPAEDVGAAARDVSSAEDFRVRVGAALVLGKARPPGARELLEKALGDANPAVRTAVAAALSALGDPAAIGALDRAMAAESSPSAKAQMRSSIAALRRTALATSPWQNARFLVQIGTMKNRSGVRGEQAATVLRTATLARVKAITGAVVADGSDASLLAQANGRHVPVLVLDGLLQHLTQERRDAEVAFDAEVEFIVRRLPEQMLRGSLSGAATSVGSLTALSNPVFVMDMQNQAIAGAVESAMRGADSGLAQAAR
jgi:hypothetical protein